MEFRNETELHYFVNDIPYYGNNKSFCLGDSLEEAGRIVRQIVESASKENSSEGSTVCGNG